MSETSDSSFSIETDATEGAAVLSLVGELDASTSDELHAHLSRFAQAGRTSVLVDLSRLSFIDSSGLNALAAGARSLEASGASLIVAGASAHIRQVFELVQLASQVRVEATMDDAVRALRSTSSSTPAP